MKKREKVTIIGSGVSGLTTAYLLRDRYDVTLIEKNSYLGGHTHTVTIDKGKDTGLEIDTGFIVCNEKNYPLFLKMMEQLDIKTIESDMSFGFYSNSRDFYYSSDVPNGLFAQRKNIFSPKFHRFIKDILRFNKQATQDHVNNTIGDISLAEYIKKFDFSDLFINYYLLPMGAAIWSAPSQKMYDFPAKSFFNFWHNHCLLQIKDRPKWRTVKNGAHSYVKKIRELVPNIVMDSVISVDRQENTIITTCKSGKKVESDKLIIATHADEALSLLNAPSNDEKKLLGAWHYSKNKTYLHTDTSLLPPKRRAWASWNVYEEHALSAENPVSVSYYMNKLQNLATTKDYIVSLNPIKYIKEENIIKEMTYTHPIFNKESLDSQAQLPSLQGNQNTYFVGSYFGYGFHEDAVRSAVNVAKLLGCDL